MSTHAHATPVIGAPKVAPARLIGTLTLAGALAGLFIVLVYQWAQPRIAAHQAAVLQGAIGEVLGAPDSVATLFVVDGRLSNQLPAGVDTSAAERVFVGYAGGRRVGYAAIGASPGFADVVTLIFGYDPARNALIGMKVLDNKETPGLGDKIVKDTMFVGEFRDVTTPLIGVKKGQGRGGDAEVDMITGVTISSRTVIRIINDRIEQLKPMLAAYEKESGA